MITVRPRHELPCEIERFWRLYLDDDFQRRAFVEGLGWSPPRVRARTEADAELTRILECEPRLSLPPAIARLLQRTLGFTEYARFDRRAQRLELRHVTNVFGDRVELVGEIWAEPLDGGRCTRCAEMTITAHVPLVGALLERTVEHNLHKGFDGSAAYIRRALAEGSAPG